MLETHELGRRPGQMRTLKRTVPAAPDLGTDIINIPEGTDLELDVRLEAVMEGILVSGSIRGRAAGECVRCLEPVSTDVETTMQELYSYPDHVVEDDEEHDIREIQDDLIDLEPAVRDAVVLALPFQPVCREDCPGLCSECGALLADDPDHHHDAVDPRWAALTQLQHDEKES